MKIKLSLAAILLASAAPAIAQTNTSTSGSGAEANSGSVSGSSADGNQQAQQQQNIGGNNAGIGNSASHSASNSDASSASNSYSGANSDQGQSQGQSASQQLTAGQSATNQQGVAVSNTFNSTQLKRTYVGTNTAVPLASSSSFSSDYCGGTASGGASVAPIGISIGGAAPTFDESCRYARVAEKAGQLGANYHNAGYADMAARAFTLEAYATCMMGPQQDKRRKGNTDNHIMDACVKLGLLGSETNAATPPEQPMVQQPSAAVTPLETQKPNGTTDDYSTLPPKNPRGDATVTGATPGIAAATP